jgi:hypothetical protein
MHPLSEMPIDDRPTAAEAADIVIKFREYLPPDGALVFMLGSFRDKIRQVQGLAAPPHATRGSVVASLDELASLDFAALWEAVGILYDGYTAFMPDPALAGHLCELRGRLAEMLKASASASSSGKWTPSDAIRSLGL